MPGRFASLWRRLRRAVSRDEWAVRLLRLSRTSDVADQPGLILVQIDGLSQGQLERALRHRRLPFLRRLLRRKGYRLHTLYSGLPSATPAVQAELFYGVRCAIPSFRYRDRQSGQVFRMFDPAPAAELQARLSQQGEGLLQGGSAYCDIFSGGAAEPHFCPSEFGWGSVWRAANPLRLLAFMLLYCDSAVRVAAMMLVELVLAMTDCARGLLAGQYLWKELGMVPSRVTVGVLLRELMTIGAGIDTARGLPIIHVNFLGYDEQAHRRGPRSRFAHWSLKGIDRAVRRIWRAARRSRRRDYQLWVYSDHGQEATVAYAEMAGKTVEQAVEEICRVYRSPESLIAQQSAATCPTGDAPDGRSRRAGRESLHRLVRGRDPVHWPGEGKEAERPPEDVAGCHPEDATNEAAGASPPRTVSVTAMGSLGQVYLAPAVPPDERERLALRLVNEAKVPLVLSAEGSGEARAWNARGAFRLPCDAAEVLGASHPFLEEIVQDLIALCHHPDAGQLILCGWSPEGQSVSFSHESGSHAGPSVHETRAFALLPAQVDIVHVKQDRGWLRPLDLRRAALELLGRSPPASTREP